MVVGGSGRSVALLLVLAGALLVACGSVRPPPVLDPATSTTPSTSIGGPPQISDLRVDPPTITPGQSTVLLWSVNDISATLSIDQGVGPVSGTSQVVAPSGTTEYTLSATNAAGTSTAQVTVTMSAASALAQRPIASG